MNKIQLPDQLLGMLFSRKIEYLICGIIIINGTVLARDESVSQRIIIEGFHYAKLCYEIDVQKYQAKILGTIGAIGNNYMQLGTGLFLGRLISRDSGTEFIATLGTDMLYSSENGSFGVINSSYTLDPAFGISMYKFFGHVIIGGAAMLDIWEFQKYSSGGYISGWYGIRRFDINPHFIVGYAF